MTVPIIGFVSIQGAILALILVSMCIYGYFSGFSKKISSFFAVVIALSVAVIPQFHGWVSESISIIFARQSRYAAYLVIFLTLALALKFIFKRLPTVVNLNLPRRADSVLGVISALVQGFAFCTMFLILIYGWRFPIDGLYARSSIASFISRVWSQTAVLPELYSTLYTNPFTLI